MMPPGTESLLDELLGVLDAEAELLERKRRQLADLSDALVRRDDDATEGLLEQIELAGRQQESVDANLGALRRTLAGRFGCRADELRLSDLIERLPADRAAQVDTRRRRIVDLAESLRAQHLRTALLLMECARINRMMLESMLPRGDTVMTYGAGGANLWRSETGLVDSEH